MNAEKLRDAGIVQSASNADSKVERWTDRAYAMLDAYPTRTFMTEELREWAELAGLPKPPSNRAWGAVIIRAKKEGRIRAIGFRNTSNPKSHATPATLWEKI